MKKIYPLFFALCLISTITHAQSLISASDGSFESVAPTGEPVTDFGGNGWTVVNGTANKFFIGTAAGASAGTFSAFTVSATDWTVKQ